LERCTFFAVDCEMTGLHTDGARHEFLDDHQTRLVCGQLPRNLEHCAAVTCNLALASAWSGSVRQMACPPTRLG
jgi:hypothetical protein